jgi:hypothetical protein
MAEWYTAEEDDDMLRIAQKFGFRNWKRIYDDPENSELRKKRPDPFILYKGDRVWIPDKNPKEFRCNANKKHTFILPEPTMIVQLVLEDGDQEPCADTKYEIWLDKQKWGDQERRTRSDGLIYAEVPMRKEVELRVWFDKEREQNPAGYESYILDMGHLDPINTVEGVQDRLNSLGYSCGDEHGTIGPKTTEALKAFQADFFADDEDFEPTGEIDVGNDRDPTIIKLKEEYGR